MVKILVTGGAGFVGSHVAEYFARRSDEVVVLDNVSRARTLTKADKGEASVNFNWNHLKKYDNVELNKGDIRDRDVVEKLAKDVDVIIHTAAQVAVTSSIIDPRTDFEVNALGTFNVLEAAKKSKTNPVIIFCSTNKVYGDNVNKIPVKEENSRYVFADEKFRNGIPETFSIDRCEHTPYGCSKLAADLYVQDYGHRYEVDTGIFRMSCIYGTRQFGNEEQGWVAHFVISTILGRPLTIFGDGKQVRDILFVTDLVKAYGDFIKKRDRHAGEVFNIGGGVDNTISLLELLDALEDITGKRTQITYDDWRPGDQKVYISDISKAKNELGWSPEVGVEDGVRRLVGWVEENKNLG